MKSKIHNRVIALIFCLAVAIQVKGQVSYYVGQTVSLSVEKHAGSTYYWSVYADVNTSIAIDASLYSFTSPANDAETTIVFSQAGTYYPAVFESSTGGCFTGRYIPIVILENQNTVQFSNSGNTICFGELEPSYSIPVTFTDQAGNPLVPSHFPITINLTIDGGPQTPQSISYADQQLIIDPALLSGGGTSKQTYAIAITGATDAQNLTIQAQTGHDTYTLTTLAQPQITFNQNNIELNQYDQQSFTVSGETDFIYHWELTDPNGATTILSSIDPQTETISFDLAGAYVLTVRAKALNGCESEVLSKAITVNPDESDPEPTPEVVPTFAVNDINLGWKNQLVTGSVLSNDLYGSGTIELTVISQPDASLGKLKSFNRTSGEYTFEPSAGFTGDAVFQYLLCETRTDGTKLCSKAQATIQVLDTNLSVAGPAAADKFFAVGVNGSLSGNFLIGDINLSQRTSSISNLNQSSLNGKLTTTNDGSFNYTSATDFSGAVDFNYKVCDGSNCDWATVTIYVLDTEFDSQYLFAGDEGFYNSGILNASLPANRRVDGATDYNYSVVTGPADGTVLLNGDGTFTYTPNAGQTGYFTDQFVYRICTSAGCSQATAYVSSYIEEPVAIVKNIFTTGACVPITLDASKSTGVEPLVFSWSPAANLSDAASAAPLFVPGESTGYTLTLTDALGNTDSRTVTVQVDAAPDVVTDPLIFVENSGQSLLLDASASTGVGLTFSWTSGNNGVIVSGQNKATPEVKGVGKYYVDITDRNGCTDRDSVIVGVWIQAVDDQTQALVNAYVSINVLRNDIPQGDLNPSSVSIVVPPSNGIAEVQPDSTIIYTPDLDFIGQDNFVYQVCTFTKQCDEATVLVMVNEESLFIPNAFTPNGDGYNDYFEIKGLDEYTRPQLEIFNRWGNLVYQSNNYGSSTGFWNGVANRGIRVGDGQVPSGTYFYYLNLGTGNGKLSGFIYIDR